MAKRRNASANTGMTATSGLDNATYVPTSAIDAVSSKYAKNLDDVGAVLMARRRYPTPRARLHMHMPTHSAAASHSMFMMIALLP